MKAATTPPVAGTVATATGNGQPLEYRLSKSRFVAGRQCHKLLWWKVHEPKAVELQPSTILEDRFDQSRQVGELAREQFPGGTFIDFPHYAVTERAEATRKAMDEMERLRCVRPGSVRMSIRG